MYMIHRLIAWMFVFVTLFGMSIILLAAGASGATHGGDIDPEIQEVEHVEEISVEEQLAQTEVEEAVVDEDEEGLEQRLDRHTAVVESGYDSDRGIAWVDIESETPQQVTVTDGGALMAGGEMDQSTVGVSSGETTRITVDATEYQGMVGVSIAVDSGLYGHPIDRGSFLSMPTRNDWLALLVGVLGTLGSMTTLKKIMDWRRNSGVLRVDG